MGFSALITDGSIFRAINNVLVRREIEAGVHTEGRSSALRAGIFKALRIYSIRCELIHRAALRRPAQFIVSMSPAELSLSMVAPPQCPLPFHRQSHYRPSCFAI
jgi:hypothetical protein